MAKGKKKVTLYLETEQAAWLDGKTAQGYKKSEIMRLLIGECLSNRQIREEPARARGSGIGADLAYVAQPIGGSPKNPKVDLESTLIEEAIEELAKREKLKGRELEGCKSIDWGFKNLDKLDGRSAFALGMFKANMLWIKASDDAI